MGAWGVGIFENDSALDFIGDLTETGNFDLVEKSIEKIVKSSKMSLFSMFSKKDCYIEETECSEALVAVAIILYLKGKKVIELPEELSQWLDKDKYKIKEDFIIIAKRVVNIIKTKSELKDLWEESEEYDEWVKEIEKLEACL